MRFRTALKVTILCLTWYLTSSFNNVIGKQLLTQFEYPMTLTLIQLLSITIYSIPLLHTTIVRNNNNNNSSSSIGSQQIPNDIYWKIIIPLAFGKFISSVSSHFAIWKVTVSYAHTVKATMPLFTVTIQRLLFHETQSTPTYLSLIPIITGVAIATITELSFNTTGLLTALLATCGFSLQNIFSKLVLKKTSIHQFTLLHRLARLSLILFLPFWLLLDFRSLLSHNFESTNTSAVLFLLFLDGLLNFLQNILAFTILNLVSPLTYAVANATKRIFIITLSIFLLRNPVTPLNVFGIFLALVGVFTYNRAKLLDRRNNKEQPYLPLHHHTNNNNNNNKSIFV